VRQVVYIAAPYRADTLEGIRWNIERAVALAALAVKSGLAPILPHVHGPAYILAAGKGGECEEADAFALAGGLAQVRLVGRAAGILWLLKKDNGSSSEGCRAEFQEFILVYPTDEGGNETILVCAETWEGWRPQFEENGLGDEWERLR
jgi:hypothetical protein